MSSKSSLSSTTYKIDVTPEMERHLETYITYYPRRRINTENMNGILKIIVRIVIGNNLGISTCSDNVKQMIISIFHLVIQDEYKKSLLSTKEFTDLHLLVEKEMKRLEWEDCAMLWCMILF